MITTACTQDDAELDAFLALHAHSSMYLRAELRRNTIRSQFAVTRERGRIVGAAAQVASGMLILQAPVHAGALAAAVLRGTGRRLAGFFGPASQVQAARHALALDATPFLKDTQEDLFALVLAKLRMPPLLDEVSLRCRIAADADAALLGAWRAAFRQAALNDVPGPELDHTSRADIAALLPAGSLFILEGDGPLACCSFNARLPGMVQIGNVWTPPALRGKGYGRAVVAGALAIAARSGVGRAVLSTGRGNVAAQTAYRALGFQQVGDYATATISAATALPELPIQAD